MQDRRPNYKHICKSIIGVKFKQLQTIFGVSENCVKEEWDTYFKRGKESLKYGMITLQ